MQTAPWEPPPTVRRHNGDPLSGEEDFVHPPPAEIGTVISADCSLTKNQTPMSGPARALVTLAIGFGVGLAIVFTARANSVRSGSVSPELLLLAATFSLIAAALALYATRFRRSISYVGVDGIASGKIKGSRDTPVVWKVLQFAEVTALYTSETRQYYNGIYTGTVYNYTWRSAAGKAAFSLASTYNSKQSSPKAKDPYWLARAAEVAWSDYQVLLMNHELEVKGFVEFPISSKQLVRVGRGFLEFDSKGETARITPEEIREVRLNGGEFFIAHKDAKWFSRKGKFSFSYSKMPNARLFAASIESLLGYRFG